MHNNNNNTNNTVHFPSEGVIEENPNDEDTKSDKSIPDESKQSPLERHISSLQSETEMNLILSNILQVNTYSLKSNINKPHTKYQSYLFVKDRKEDIKTLNDYFLMKYNTANSIMDDISAKINITKSELKWVRKEQDENMNHKQQLMSDNLGGLAWNYFTERFPCGNVDAMSVCRSTRNEVLFNAHSRCPSVLPVNMNDDQKLKHLKEKLSQLEQSLLNKKKTYPNKKKMYEQYKKEHKLLLEKYKQKQLILENIEDEIVKLKEIAESKEKENPQEKKKSFFKKLFH